MTDPSRFVAHYEADECDSSYELWNCKVPRIYLPCDECDQRHYHNFKYLEYRVREFEFHEWDFNESDLD